jgi:hypothetical protein
MQASFYVIDRSGSFRVHVLHVAASMRGYGDTNRSEDEIGGRTHGNRHGPCSFTVCDGFLKGP